MILSIILAMGMVGTSVRVTGLPWLMQSAGGGGAPSTNGLLLSGGSDYIQLSGGTDLLLKAQ